MNQNGLPTISASKIKTYRACAKKYEYTYIHKPPITHTDERNVGALLGTALHKVIEAKYKDNAINPLALYQEKMLKTLSEWQTAGYKINGEQYFGKSLKEGKEILEKFDWNRFDPLELEMYFSIPFPNKINPFCTIIGYIDLIDKNCIVVDHKSQRKQPNVEELAHDAQFILYRHAFHSLYGLYPHTVYYHNLRSGELIDTHVEDNYGEKLIQLAHDIKAMLDAEQFSRINLSSQCRNECGFYSLCWS